MHFHIEVVPIKRIFTVFEFSGVYATKVWQLLGFEMLITNLKFGLNDTRCFKTCQTVERHVAVVDLI